MTSASRKEAENFHVMPKGKTARDVGKQPIPDPGSPAVTNADHVEPRQNISLSPNGDRDPEAGSFSEDPNQSGQVNQPLDAVRRQNRSDVS